MLDADRGRAHWVSADLEPADWTRGYVHDHTTDGLPAGYARDEEWTGPAPALDLDGPRVEVRDRTDGTVTLRVASGRARRG